MNKIIERWRAETPAFWKKVRNTAMTLSGSATAVVVANSSLSLTLPPSLITACSYVIAVGAALGVSSQLTKK